MKRKYAFGLLLFCIAYALPLSIPAQNTASFKHLNVSDGLPQNSIFHIFQDSRGYMWICTSYGIGRYDGHNISVYRHDKGNPKSIAQNLIYNGGEDKNHQVWFEVSKGLQRFNFLTNDFTSFEPDKEMQKGKNVKVVLNSLVSKNTDYIYIAATTGLLSFNINEEVFKKEAAVNFNHNCPILQFNNDKLLLATSEGLQLYDTKTKKASSAPFNSPLYCNSTEGSFVQSMQFDKEGKLCITTTVNGLIIVDTSSNTVIHHFTDDGNPALAQNDLLDVIADHENNLWLTTRNSGLNFISSDRKSIQSYRYDPVNHASLSFDITDALAIDHNGSLWVGTNGGGINILNLHPPEIGNFKITNARKIDYQQNYIKALYEAKDTTLWIGSNSNGLVHIDRTGKMHSWHTGDRTLPKASNSIHKIIEDNDNLWLGTRKGIYLFDRTDKTFSQPVSNHLLLSNLVYCMHRRGSELWVGNDNGLQVIDLYTNTSQTIYTKTKDDFFDGIVYDLIAVSDSLYIAIFSQGGFIAVDPVNKIIKHKYATGNKSVNLPSDIVRAVHYEDNRLFMGTLSGLYIYNLLTDSIEQVEEFELLQNFHICTILRIKEGIYLVSTKSGIFLIDRNTNSTYSYNDFPELKSTEFIPRGFVSATGLVYLATADGIKYFDPLKLKAYVHQKEKIIITSISTSERTHYYDPYEMNSLALGYNENSFQVNFSLFSSSGVQDDKVYYMLEGVDDDWKPAVNMASSRYAHLDPGNYKFKIGIKGNEKAMPPDAMTVLPVTIIPPYWKTWWFVLIQFIAIAAVIIYTIYRFSTRKLRKALLEEKRMREIETVRMQLSRDIHDDIGAGLSRLALMSDLAAKQVNDKKELDFRLNKIAQTSRSMVNNLAEMIWSLNPRHDSVEGLNSYIRSFTSDFFEGTGISCTVSQDAFTENIHLSPEERRNIFLIIKEACNNCIKHSSARTISVVYFQDEAYLKWTIKDDGKGMTAVNGHNGNGLNNMKKRMEEMNGQLAIEANPSGGVMVELKIKRKKG